MEALAWPRSSPSRRSGERQGKTNPPLPAPGLKKSNLVWLRFAGSGAGGEDAARQQRGLWIAQARLRAFRHKMELVFGLSAVCRALRIPFFFFFSSTCAQSAARSPERGWVWALIPRTGACPGAGCSGWGLRKALSSGKEGFAQGQSILGWVSGL